MSTAICSIAISPMDECTETSNVGEVLSTYSGTVRPSFQEMSG